MALTDINMTEGDGQPFLLELPEGTLGTPTDIVAGSDQMYPVEEIPAQSGGGNIFIMSE